jgi:hypothetical protein
MPLPHSTGIVPGALISCSSLPLALYMGRSEARGGGAVAAAKAAGQTLSACDGRSRCCLPSARGRGPWRLHGRDVPKKCRVGSTSRVTEFLNCHVQFYGEWGFSKNPHGSAVVRQINISPWGQVETLQP